jgi:predicted nucleic acid-binding protein
VIFLLDTNVLSERTKVAPDPAVAAFLRKVPAENIRISAIVLGEIAQGVNSNPTPDVQLFLQEISSFPIAEFGEAEALEWGRLTSEGFKRCLSMQARDTMIAATASVRGWMVATANVADFKPLGVQVFNPWKDKL